MNTLPAPISGDIYTPRCPVLSMCLQNKCISHVYGRMMLQLQICITRQTTRGGTDHLIRSHDSTNSNLSPTNTIQLRYHNNLDISILLSINNVLPANNHMIHYNASGNQPDPV